MTKRAASYARINSDDPGRSEILRDQIEACRRYAIQRGYSIVGEYQDNSSGNILSRPGLDMLRELAQQGAIEVVVACNVERLSRRLAGQFVIEDELRECSVDLEFAQVSYEPSPESQLRKTIRATLDEYVREVLQARRTLL